ncbi:MAG: PPC domain-containing DNA-binding protein [Promethearchaeota archaeon]
MVHTLQTGVKRVIISRMMPGEDVLETIEKIATEFKVESGQINLIGAIAGAKLGYFDTGTNEYRDFTVDENVEVVSCMGNISRLDGKPLVHAHMIVSDEAGRCYGGHLMRGCTVSVTIELIIIETAAKLTRRRDERTGLNLLSIT